uniref:GED domain-containing protein n=1 Tax=Panagrolaimus davidi TaxID=227884 RepID=A0A914QGZ9_9BILA
MYIYGLKPAIFIPERSFDILIKKQMKRFKKPVINCIDLVNEELLRIIQNCGNDIKTEMERFPLLYDRIRKVVSTILKARIIKTKEFVEDYLEIELAFINTKHPEFIINEDLLKAFNEKANDEDLEDLRDEGDEDEEELLKSLTNREKRDLHIISRLIDQYFQIVQKSIKDKVPKAIMKFLINYIIENLHNELIERLYDPFNVDELLVESGNIRRL